ncbi:MAG TPA: Ger(x)C family spore germination protein [Sporosarcina psychrophila]|uniref:Ger(X)C family spore germination protein n=1 Tax=Sporosarcina psychrophila TaxID=1476 RepID=A0A921KDN7_SPOPS|nr:Ger(x)C family spore germination protein [Sporosarcina psychrophila]
MSGTRKMIKGCLAASMLIVLLMQAGCSFKDIDKRIFVLGIGIDPSETVKDGFRVTLKLAKPSGAVKQEASQSFSYLSHDSESVAEAIRSMESHVDKTLDLGHTRIILLNKELLSKDLDTFMDYFTRRGDIQLISYVAVAETNAEETISFAPDTEPPATIALYNFFDTTGTESPYVVTTFLFEFRREVLSKGINTVLPIVAINKEQKHFIINKSIVLNWGEKPLELNQVETKYFNSLVNKASGFSYKIEEDDLTMVLNINQVKMKYKIVLDEGQNPRIDMKVTKVGVIGESTKRLDNSHLKKYDKIVADDIEKKLMELLTTLQKNDVDPFGFGLRYRATRLSHKDIMNEWDRIYPEIDFNVTMDIQLKSTGVIE